MENFLLLIIFLFTAIGCSLIPCLLDIIEERKNKKISDELAELNFIHNFNSTIYNKNLTNIEFINKF